jgi:hypothetical protein
MKHKTAKILLTIIISLLTVSAIAAEINYTLQLIPPTPSPSIPGGAGGGGGGARTPTPTPTPILTPTPTEVIEVPIEEICTGIIVGGICIPDITDPAITKNVFEFMLAPNNWVWDLTIIIISMLLLRIYKPLSISYIILVSALLFVIILIIRFYVLSAIFGSNAILNYLSLSLYCLFIVIITPLKPKKFGKKK